VPDDPAEDADGDGFVADVAGGPSVALIDGACEACLDVGGCECAPADTEFAIPRAVDVCTEDVCEVPSEPIKRRCVSSPLNGEPCVAGFLNCGEACQAEGVAQVLGDCGQQPLELDCGERACDPRATDGVSWACERHSDGLVACPWRGKLAGLIDGLNNEATCTGARVWGAEGLGLKLLGQLVGAVPGGALAPIGPLDAAVCKTLILQALEAPELGERHVIVEVTSDFGIAATTYVVPIRIEAAAIDGNACEPNDVEDDACAHL
jgi:hypothetical protein